MTVLAVLILWLSGAWLAYIVRETIDRRHKLKALIAEQTALTQPEFNWDVYNEDREFTPAEKTAFLNAFLEELKALGNTQSENP